jgi:hypothetical protein
MTNDPMFWWVFGTIFVPAFTLIGWVAIEQLRQILRGEL